MLTPQEKQASSTAIRGCPMMPLNWTDNRNIESPFSSSIQPATQKKKKKKNYKFLLYFVNYTLNT